jgi:hypothetical protein
MSAGWKTSPVTNNPEEYWPDDAMHLNLNDRVKWVPDSFVEEARVSDGARTPTLALVHGDPPHEDWQQPHEDKQFHMFPTTELCSPVLNETRSGEPEFSREFNQAFLDAIATMRSPRTKLQPRDSQKPYPSIPDLSRVQPTRKEVSFVQQTSKHSDSFESIESE